MVDRRGTGSPSLAIERRDALEKIYVETMLTRYDAFVAEVLEMAKESIDSASYLVASAEPRQMSYTAVMERWRAAVREMAETLPGAHSVGEILYRADMPLDLMNAVNDVLTVARVNGWSTWWTKVQLGKALIPKQEDGQSRPAYRESVRRVGRTLATHRSAETQSLRIGRGGYKRWVAVGDRKTRPTHAAVDGVTIPVREKFTVGSDELEWPGDYWNGSPRETVNCRCVLVEAPPPAKARQETPEEWWDKQHEKSYSELSAELDACGGIHGDYEPGSRCSRLRAYFGYMREEYRGVNNLLRNGMRPDITELEAAFDSLGRPLMRESTVYRGVQVSPFFDPSTLRPGQVLLDPAYLSTSMSKDVARRFSQDGGWVMNIRTQMGSFYVPGSATEKELIFMRDQMLEVVDVDPVSREVFLRMVSV